jgi:hypothetical protein
MLSDPPPVNHQFKLAKLAYDTPIHKQNYLCIAMFFNKKPGISDEYFQNHWHHVHADLVTSSRAFRELKILRYNQFRQRPEHRALLNRIGYPGMDWDACTEFWVEKFEDFEAFTKSQEYIDATRKLCTPFSGF